MPVLEGTREKAAEGVARGAYILAEASSGTPEVVILATGSEVQLAVAARETLEADGVATRVVSVPVLDRFLEQDQAYRDEVLPPSCAPACPSRPVSRCRGTASSATPVSRSRSSTTAPPPTTRPCTASSASLPSRRRRRASLADPSEGMIR
ncbi:hypothetical protein NJ76_15025 [Rhodococcus sp. IITR03]|nr:hypothetical protein NJ76_15025 [Rhodococcus sp. IITR03]